MECSNPKSGSRCLYRRFRRRLDLDSFWLGLEALGFVSNPSARPRTLLFGPEPFCRSGPFCLARALLFGPEFLGLAANLSCLAPNPPGCGRCCRVLLIALERGF